MSGSGLFVDCRYSWSWTIQVSFYKQVLFTRRQQKYYIDHLNRILAWASTGGISTEKQWLTVVKVWRTLCQKLSESYTRCNFLEPWTRDFVQWRSEAMQHGECRPLVKTLHQKVSCVSQQDRGEAREVQRYRDKIPSKHVQLVALTSCCYVHHASEMQ